MVDCDVRTRQNGLTSLHRPRPLLCADGHAITIAASSTLVQAAGRCTMDEGVDELSRPLLPLSTCTGLRLVGAELVESVSAASAMQSRCSRKSGTWTSVHRE